MQFADTHCHLDFQCFDAGRAALLDKCRDAFINMLVVPSVARSSWVKVMSMKACGEGILPALGLHPYFVSEHCDNDLIELEERLDALSGEVVAIGEIGLDAFVDCMDRQVFFFEQQLELAKTFELPVIVHSRKSHSQIYKRIKTSGVERGVIHAFSGSAQEANSFVSLGMSIGVGGVITWPRARKTRGAIARLPLNSIVLETDSPGMPVVGQMKGGGSPLDLLVVFKVLSEIREEAPEVLAGALWENSKRLFSC